MLSLQRQGPVNTQRSLFVGALSVTSSISLGAQKSATISMMTLKVNLLPSAICSVSKQLVVSFFLDAESLVYFESAVLITNKYS